MIKPTDLKTQSNNTFFDNDQGLINPGAHRTFNNAVIDYIQAGQPATFVIDSNDALMAWANNTAGNDYTHILIRPGTFEVSRTINLDRAGTKTVVGMGGSKIKITATVGLQGNNNNECRLIGVNVEIPSGAPTVAFHSCNHLVGCTGKVTCYGSTDYGAFYNCHYLTDCVGICTASYTYAAAFTKCLYLTNCYGTSTNLSSLFSYGFYMCNYLTNCTSIVQSSSYAIGFGQCRFLMNCEGTGICMGAGAAAIGFFESRNLTSCTGIGTGNQSGGFGFRSCSQIINCKGVGTSNATNGYSFLDCRNMFGCNTGGESTSGVYSNCYMGQGGLNNPISDSAAGGYNWS